ncbi:lysylphosphatidylglycerol synthase domain-containing protein [Nevskia soli]|uniref:lysylphosphatidylglycerol synthase domain-containing protein n=1 Tax=Nevskia soli TaxID=418856 RepID=UPI00068FB820|nr:lysylphosphatidylglycerol synthase domain-containing protein [Nevskia soli]
MKAARDYKSLLLAAITLAVFVIAIWVLHHSLAKLRLSDVLASIEAEPWPRVAACAFFSACSYGMLTFYDYLALRGVRHPLPWRRVSLTSFIAFAIGHSAGLSMLSGGSVRYRSYIKEGLSAFEIAGVVGLVSVTFALGIGTMLGLSLLLESQQAARILHLDHAWEARLLGTAIFVLILGYLWLTQRIKRPLRIREREFRLPPFHIGLGQIVVASIDLCFAAASLYVLLPDGIPLHFFSFVGLYVLALQSGVISNVPGGVGVFESVLIQLLPGGATAELVSAVLLYRFIYYFVPLVLGVGLFAGREAMR